MNENSSDNSHLSELGNAISSLIFTVFGLIGITLRNNTTIYYLVMYLFILMGITSFMHHYYYSYAGWAHASDIITMELLTSFSLFYIVCDIEYHKYKFINRIYGFIIITSCLSMIVFFATNNENRTLLLQITMVIIETQHNN